MEKLLGSFSKNVLPIIQEKLLDIGMSLLVLILGLLVIGIIVSFIRSALEKRKVEPTLIPFITTITSVVFKVSLFISAASMVGIKTTSFVAVLGAAGLAVGLALQGSLSNFAGGVLIIILRPFKVGDFIEGGGHSGTVKEVQIFYTILLTTDNKTIIIPNGSLANESIINYSTQLTRRVDFVFGVAYSDDFNKGKEILKKLISEDDRVLKDPESLVRVSSLGASSVDITVRAWVKKEDYWGFFFDMTEKVKMTFDSEGLNFPFPQRELSLNEEAIRALTNRQ